MERNSTDTEAVDIERYLSHSAKIETGDLDWAEARGVGLTENEIFILTYFSDIESQTIVYLRDLLNTRAALEPEVIAFLTMWNYEEFFHGKVLARLLVECGHPLGRERIAKVRKAAQFSETLLAGASRIVSKLLPESFLSLYMTWGALNELTTLFGYERLEGESRNPILKELCQRIAKQERRHFAWYFNSARERLGRSALSQRFTKMALSRFWSPVGAGVKSDQEVTRLIFSLFSNGSVEPFAREVDGKISTLPGLEGIRPMGLFVGEAAKKERSHPHFSCTLRDPVIRNTNGGC